MKSLISEFIDSKEKLLRSFGCDDDYHIESRLGLNWEIIEDDGVFFLSCWENIGNKTTSVIVKKNDEPLLYESADYTMVIAIDCIKIAFIFNNVLKVQK
ncbi:MAG: hypothetical protein FWE24_05270 [Defluviitaleaceae bacterium]|nr:hypothetical protein [Defluviitaleaceae bacterium]